MIRWMLENPGYAFLIAIVAMFCATSAVTSVAAAIVGAKSERRGDEE